MAGSIVWSFETTNELSGDAVITIRGAEWPAAEGTGDAAIEAFEADVDEGAVGSTVNGFEEVGGGDVDINEADLLVSIGRGIEEEENLDLIRDLADADALEEITALDLASRDHKPSVRPPSLRKGSRTPRAKITSRWPPLLSYRSGMGFLHERRVFT